jgi:hypothetical protein
MIRVLIRKPDSVKKTSTPMPPPFAKGMPLRWFAITARTANARMPSSAGR